MVGKKANAVNLDGSNDYVSLPAGTVNGLTNFSIATWVKLDMVSAWRCIFDFGTGTTANMFLTPHDPEPLSLVNTTQNWVGRSEYSADPYLDGQMDEFRIFNRALSASEVLSLFQNP